MRDPKEIETLDRILGLGARSFVRYLIEGGRPWERSDWDRRALSAFEAWHRDGTPSLAAIEGLLAAEKVHPSLPLWPIEFAQYNLLSPVYLLGPVIERTSPAIEAIDAEAGGLSGWPEAREVVEAMVAMDREHLRTVEAIEAERPKEPPKPAVKKGVSANFW